RNLFRAAYTTYRHAFLHCLESLALTGCDHLVSHRRPDKPRAYGIDTDAACRIFESRALGEPKDSVLGGVVDPALGASHKSPERRAIDDGATSLFAHLLQFELHAAPFAAEIDPHDAIVIFTGGVGSLCEDILDARVVIGGIKPAKDRDRLRDHGF